MKKLLVLVAAVAVAYLIGARDGPARLARMKQSALRVRRDHVMSDAVATAAEAVNEKASKLIDGLAETGQGVAEKIADTAVDLAESVQGNR